MNLLPEPQSVQLKTGTFTLAPRPAIGIPGYDWLTAAQALQLFLPKAVVQAAAPSCAHDILLVLAAEHPAEGYRLTIRNDGVRIASSTPRGAFWGVQTLRQIAAQNPSGKLPCVDISDAPDLADRGYYYDVTRGRVPHRDRLRELIDLLAAHKMNHLQFYIEHTFAFRGHPSIGKGASPLTAGDIIDLDAHATGQYVELVPSLAAFGHLMTVLQHPEYRHLAEDYGIGKYVNRDDVPGWAVSWLKGWSLAPANPKVYDFLDSLFAEFLPLFRSKRFNVCCDETWDLGCGQSYELAKKIGKGELYVRHLLRLYELCGKYGKQMMFWGDIVRKYPEVMKKLPKDIVALDWGYGYDHNFAAIQDFQDAGLPVLACPSTSSYVAFFPRIPQARANIAGFVAAAKKAGAQGMLNTEWGDGGHYNFLECSWSEILFGAEQSWNGKAGQPTFSARFMARFLNFTNKQAPRAAKTLDRLGEISFLGAQGYYQSALRHIFFALPDDRRLFGGECLEITECSDGKIFKRQGTLDQALGLRLEKELCAISAEIKKWKKLRGVDPHCVLNYWIFAVDCLLFAARKLAILAGPCNTPANRRKLAAAQEKLLQRFESLWLARNQRSEISITVKCYRKAIRGLLK